MLQFKAYHYPYLEMSHSKIFFVKYIVCKKLYRLVDFSVQKVLCAQQSCKNVIAVIRILVVNKFYMKERKKNNNASLSNFLIKLLYDKTFLE